MLKDGKNENISNLDYHADRKYISSSGIKLLLENKLKFHQRYVQNMKGKSQGYFDVGTRVHQLILEPHLDDSEFVFFSGRRRYGIEYNEFVKDNPGKIIITKEEERNIQLIVENFNKYEELRELVSGGNSEDTYCAKINGINCKIRLDYKKDNRIIDLKTTSKKLNKENLEQAIIDYGYHISAAFYIDVYKKATNTDIGTFTFIFTNKKDHDIIVCDATKEMIELGRKEYLESFKLYKRLKKEGFFDSDMPQLLENLKRFE